MAPPRGRQEESVTAPPRAPVRATLRRLRPVVYAAVGALLLYGLIRLVVSVYTNWLWFESVHDASVYRRRLLTQIVMFAVFGGATALAVALNLWLLGRHTPYDGPAEATRLSLRLRY